MPYGIIFLGSESAVGSQILLVSLDHLLERVSRAKREIHTPRPHGTGTPE